MDSKQTVMALYSAYATGDPKKISGLLDDDVVWTAPAGNATQVALGLGQPEDAGPPHGVRDETSHMPSLVGSQPWSKGPP